MPSAYHCCRQHPSYCPQLLVRVQEQHQQLLFLDPAPAVQRCLSWSAHHLLLRPLLDQLHLAFQLLLWQRQQQLVYCWEFGPVYHCSGQLLGQVD